ncbi:DUF72 domain-containing protein [Nocardioides sp. dk4132]|uniref:DUF72 domain-containing protein n=1 Tax=unclassified Nocardioides TaxID=2615069 RepID=UPI0012980EDC|nr:MULTISPECIES: DUF72 domain-containing protein [unclassified Nocardioides]MQW75374.1 DUF72 domain-containing protein [Nocardioides sp. dk4132]QGA08304.1 DUF72 domain-containing protein [Nocardioides sp. dk884]
MGRIRVGISGWTYAGWRGDFYPKGLPQRLELAHAASRLSSVEINGSFYSLQRPTSYAAWRAQTPDDFEFAVKGGRFITHMKKLRDVQVPLANFFASGVLALGPKLGPVLWQLPATLPFDAERLDHFFTLLPRTTEEAAALARQHDAKVAEDRALTVTEDDRPIRHVLEFRSESFCTEESFDLMRRHGIGCVVADTAGRFPQAEAVTSDVVYVRLHGDTELYTSGYSPEALQSWAARCREWAREQDVYVYFDNDAKGFAPHDAVALSALLEL